MHRTRHVTELFDRRPEDVVEVGLECAISRSDEVIYHLLCASQVNEGFPDRAENLQVTVPDTPSAPTRKLWNK